MTPDQTEYAYWWNAPRPAISAYYDAPTSEEITADEMPDHPLVTRHITRNIKRSGIWNPSDKASFAEKVRTLDFREPDATSLLLRRDYASTIREQYFDQVRQWADNPAGIEQHLAEQPFFIRDVYRQKIYWLRKNREERHINAFFISTVKKALLRLEAVRMHQTARDSSSELVAYWRTRWPHLAEYSKREVLTTANEIASRVAEMFETECNALRTTPATIKDDDLFWLYRHLGNEVFGLRVTPPLWRCTLDRTSVFSSILRITSPDWWGGKLWRMRCEWRENQFRAIGVIHKKRMPYVSFDALNQWQEQRRKNREFFKAHELVDEDGNVASLENMVNASVSNPSIRRHELMNRMSGVELVAQDRGDEGVFLTITCPSRYHSNIHSGHQNPKWSHASPRQAQRYLCKVWGRATSALKRRGLRPYGFRVAEPHHDATPHWHALLFMPPDEVKETVEILRKYFTKEDRSELGKNTGVRFKAKKMDPRKGSATAYVAKYISKNIDGYALAGELDEETGKPLKETAKYAMAWASQHGIRQFQPFGQPPVTVWRELRKLNNQLESIQKEAGTFKRGAQMLADPAMDAVLAAADVGCFATYITKQGGVLIPRDRYTVRIAYEEAEEQNDYGENPEKIFGVFSPLLGEISRICTRLIKWKIRTKQATKGDARSVSAVEASAFQDGPAVPWSSVNNSTGEQKTAKNEGLNAHPIDEIDSTLPPEIHDFDRMEEKARRALLRRLRNHPPERRHHQDSSTTPREKTKGEQAFSQVADELISNISKYAHSIGWELPTHVLRRLAVGHVVDIGGKFYRVDHFGNVRQSKPDYGTRARNLLQRFNNLKAGTAQI